MTKEKIIEKLKKEIEKVEDFPDTTKFEWEIRIKEMSHCPKCHTYKGDGYSVSSFLYTEANCTVCGYSYSE